MGSNPTGDANSEDWHARVAVEKARKKVKPVLSKFEQRKTYLLDQLDIAKAAMRRQPLHWPHQERVAKLQKELDEHVQSDNIDSIKAAT